MMKSSVSSGSKSTVKMSEPFFLTIDMLTKKLYCSFLALSQGSDIKASFPFSG